MDDRYGNRRGSSPRSRVLKGEYMKPIVCKLCDKEIAIDQNIKFYENDVCHYYCVTDKEDEKYAQDNMDLYEKYPWIKDQDLILEMRDADELKWLDKTGQWVVVYDSQQWDTCFYHTAFLKDLKAKLLSIIDENDLVSFIFKDKEEYDFKTSVTITKLIDVEKIKK